MKNRRIRLTDYLVTAFSLPLLVLASNSVAQQAEPGNNRSMDPAKARVVEHWTNDRRSAAIPRDFVIDSRGLGYLRRPDGTLQPYGHQIVAETAANSPSPNAKPSGGNGTIGPEITNMDPAAAVAGEEVVVIGASHIFSATVTDDVEVRSVSFTIQYPDGSTTQPFNANAGAGDLWTVTLSGFSDGNWSWWVVAKDTAKRGGNSTTSDIVNFTVDTGGGGGGGGSAGDSGDNTVANAEWTAGGAVQTAAGRLYFEMPKNAKRKGPWAGFVCSGTAVTDSVNNDRSVILTAAHCVYDDVNNAFARNVLFIPNQAGGGSGTDLDCSNDPIGCWVPSFGVVDTHWTGTTFPNNIAWDYAYYVVATEGAHTDDPSLEVDPSLASLEVAAGTLAINFTTSPYFYDGTTGTSSSDDFTYGLGYSYNVDPNFMYCADHMTKEGEVNWWLPNCGLAGGSSGGPWVQPNLDTDNGFLGTGNGSIISVNSWGYIGSPGMAGPMLQASSAECVFGAAVITALPSDSDPPPTDGDAGVAVDCPPQQTPPNQ